MGLIAGAAAITALATPVLSALDAGSAGADTYGVVYLTADQPTAANYTPHLQFNSTGSVYSTVSRDGIGSYVVSLPNLVAPGIIHVTAYGSSALSCKPDYPGSGAVSTGVCVLFRFLG
jgi:hypothetical protein